MSRRCQLSFVICHLSLAPKAPQKMTKGKWPKAVHAMALLLLLAQITTAQVSYQRLVKAEHIADHVSAAPR